jgi:hypothetical protein
MVSPQHSHNGALLRACEAHLVRVNAAHDALLLAISSAKSFGEHDSRRLNTYVEKCEKAIRDSDAQRAKDNATALEMLRATEVTASRS